MGAKYRLIAEEAVKSVDGLPYVILRPAICYGIGDCTGLSPRITCAAVYQKTGKTMKFLWNKKLAMNVVHIKDVCHAIWIACTELKPGTTYNLAEPTDVTQGDINDVLGTIFNIKTGFLGATISNLAKIQLKACADHSNDMHVPTWTKMCQDSGIYNTPLSPHIDEELLKGSSLFINGEKITNDSSFDYSVNFSKEVVQEQITSFIDQKIFPKVELS